MIMTQILLEKKGEKVGEGGEVSGKDEKGGEKVKNEEEANKGTEEVKLTEEEVKNMVAKVEDKCQNVRDDIADMAMSEQYLRTKQAMLKAKKKEQEMEIAQKMASIRETEVLKMREKVAKMQVIFCFCFSIFN